MLPDENKKELEKSEVEKRSLSTMLMLTGTGFFRLQIFVALGICIMIIGVFKQKRSN